MRKLFFWIVIAIFSWLGGLSVIYSLRDVLVAPYLKNSVVLFARRQLGLELAIQHIGGNYLSDLEINQVRTLHSNPTGALVSLQIDRLRLHYSVFDLLLGKNVFIKNFTLDLQGARVEIKLAKPDSAHASVFAMPMLPVLPRMLIQDTVVSFESPFLRVPKLNLESRPKADGGIFLHIASETIYLQDPALKPRQLSLETDIEYTPEEISLKRLLIDHTSVLETVWVRIKDGRIKEFKLDLHSGPSRLIAAGQWLENHLAVQFGVTSSQLQKLNNWLEWPSHTLSGEMQLQGQANVWPDALARSIGKISLHCEKGVLMARPMDRLDLSLALRGGELFMEQAEIVSGSNWMVFQEVAVPVAPVMQGQWGQLLGSIRGKFTTRLNDIPLLMGEVHREKIKLPPHVLTLQGEVRNGELEIQKGVLEMDQGRFQVNRFSAGVKALAGSWLELPFDADITLQAGDLAPWAKLLGISGMNGAWEIEFNGQGRLADFKANAQARCLDLRYQPSEAPEVYIRADKLDFQAMIQGSIHNPLLTGKLSLEDGQIKIAPGFPVIRDIQFASELNASRLTIQTFAARMGGSALSISGTVADVFGGQPTFDLRLQGANLLLYRSEDLRVRADTDIAVTGPFSEMRVSGEERITNGLYNRDIDFLGYLKPNSQIQTKAGLVLFSLTDPPFKHMQFAVKITSDTPFMIKNNAATGSVRPELFLGGTGEVPVLTGKVYVDSTLVALPTGILTIQSGVISFLENSPEIPRLDILAQAKMQGYDISLRVAGPYDKPAITLSSIPPAPNDQLLLLVLTGQSPQAQTGQRFVSTGNLALYFGQGVAGSLFGKSGRGTLERLQLNIGRDISRNGKETLEAQFQIIKNWLTTQDAVYLTSERDIYDDYNAGAKIVFQFK